MIKESTIREARLLSEELARRESSDSPTFLEAVDDLQTICCRILADWNEGEDTYGLRDSVRTVRKLLEVESRKSL